MGNCNDRAARVPQLPIHVTTQYKHAKLYNKKFSKIKMNDLKEEETSLGLQAIIGIPVGKKNCETKKAK